MRYFNGSISGTAKAVQRLGSMMGGKPPMRNRDMAKANPLQEQLLKAGLVKKSKVAEVAREQHKARHAKAASDPAKSSGKRSAHGPKRPSGTARSPPSAKP